jgi:2-keto-4-pentenoate hydratase
MSELDRSATKAIAQRLWQAAQSGVACSPVRDAIAQLGGDPLRAAYEVQRVNTERRLTSGERLVGCTVGLTSRAVQAQLGVDQPDFGMLFDAMAVADGEEIAMSRTQQAKVEAEIALVLERDLPHERHTLAGPMVAASAGDVFTASIEGLGTVSASFSTQSEPT